jgi:hypothetical protein
VTKRKYSPSIPAAPHLRRELRDPVVASELLDYAAAEGDPSDFLHALRKVAEANDQKRTRRRAQVSTRQGKGQGIKPG